MHSVQKYFYIKDSNYFIAQIIVILACHCWQLQTRLWVVESPVIYKVHKYFCIPMYSMIHK